MQLGLFEDLEFSDSSPKINTWTLEEVFEAYYDCRRKKRNKPGAIGFETDLESNLVELWKELNNGTYKPGVSSVFVVDKPVTREIFAAEFRDRVVHHLLIKRLNPFFEKEFIHDSYACRKGKGTHFGVNRITRFIRRCSKNYNSDCYLLKLDIQGFFMNIDRSILESKLEAFIMNKYTGKDRAGIIELSRKIIENEPTRACKYRSHMVKWSNIPANKSLFCTPEGKGLPIGNLSSQVFANFYLNSLDHYIKHVLNIKYYGRYVDDLVLIDENSKFLIELVPRIRNFLWFELGLVLHPKKIKQQHYSKGIAFLGVIIKPGRHLPGLRSRENFRKTIENQNIIIEQNKPDKQARERFRSVCNSYLGILSKSASWRFRVMLIRSLSPWWKKIIRVPKSANKIIFR